MKRRFPQGVTLVGLGRAGIALGLLAVTSNAQCNVVKCVDANGNITYQDVPCTAGQAGRSVELPQAEAREDTSAWEAAARDARVIKGMPKRWVLRSRGAPAEIRRATPSERATEVWRYAAKDGALLVGFAGPDVAWVLDEAAPRTTAPPAPGGDAATRGAQNRRFVIAGRFCEHVFAEIGAADREELAKIWNISVDRMPTQRGLAYPDIIEACLERKIRALWIIATNPIVSFPNLHSLQQALESLDFLVVQDGYHPTPTSEYS